MKRRGEGQLCMRLKDKVVSLMQAGNDIHIVDEIWIAPVIGFWLKEDCYRWEGQIRGMLGDKSVHFTIESYDTVRDSVYRKLQYQRESWMTYFFWTDR